MPPAETLGRYRLLRSLGRGGMGVVHLAVAHGPAGFEKVVALKLLDERFRGDQRRAEGLLREALVGGRLDHEHLVQILDLGFEVDQYFIAMEYVRGHSLSHVLAHLARTGRQLPVFLAVRVVRAVVDALVYMHAVLEASGQPLGLVHGDISPSNVLLGADSRVKLSDFGVVALSGEHRTQLPGKMAYFPPEAFRGQVRTQNWDVFAVGAVLYEALAGRRAFDGSGSAAHTPLVELRPDCPPALAEVVERTIAAEPASRLFRAADLAQALDDAYPGAPGDRERHRGYLQALYGEPDFVQAHGELPSESGLPGRAVQVIAVEETEQATVRAVSTARGLRFGLSQAHGSERARRSGDRLAGELTARVGRPVRTVVLADYQSVTDALASGDLDLAWMPPLALVQALDRGAGLLAVARRAGATIYHSCVLVHADSKVTRLEELAGGQAAFVDRQSASGYAFAMAGLIAALGAGAGGLRAHFHGSHRAVCEAVANRWADFGASYAVLALDGAVASSAWSELTPERAGELRSIWTSAAIPGDAVAHRPHLGEQTVAQVRESLLAMARERSGAAVLREVFHAEQLVAGSAREYEPARAVQRALAGVRI